MPQHIIPEPEYTARLKKVMEAITPKGRADNYEALELFRLYNDRLEPYESESSTFCSGCVARVFARMQEYYKTIQG